MPCRYVGKSTTVKAYPNHIEVWIAGTLVARHDRLFGRREESLDLQHYLPILVQKGRAIRYATMVSALVDRLTYKPHVLDMSGPSYRLRTSQVELSDECIDGDQ